MWDLLTDFGWNVYLFLPAFVANAAPVIAKNIPGLHTWNDPILPNTFGKNKTMRGFAVGFVAAVLTALLQFAIDPAVQIVFYFSLGHALSIGALLGLGALGGDLIESAIKRELGYKPGEALPIIDGIDYIIGAIVALSLLYLPSWPAIIFLIVFAPIASLVANMISYWMGWKERWY
jgi:CDP-2,3-bis-(O-geranylgeranyl)-sn-glycerol synthase